MVGTDAEELQNMDRVLRVDALDRLVASASAGDGAAIDVLRSVARNYREFDIEIWGRALNRVEVFIDDSLRAPIVAAVADEAYGGQAHAAMVCGRLGYAEAAPAIALVLQHAKGFDRSIACEALGDLALPEYASVLGERLDDEHEWTRAAAADALAAIGTNEALELLWAALMSKSFDRPHYLANAIAQFDDRAFDRLAGLAGDPDPNMRYWAARALGSTGDPRAVAILQAMIDDHGETAPFIGYVATAAHKALKTQGRMAVVAHQRGRTPNDRGERQAVAVEAEGLGDFVRALSRLMNDGSVLAYVEDEHERYWLYGAARLDEALEPVLLECLRLDPDSGMASSVLFAMLDGRDAPGRRALLVFAPEGSRDRLEKRSTDLDLRDEVLAGDVDGSAMPLALPRLLESSNNIQLVVAENSDDPIVLEHLVENGRTKRVRHVAAERLRRTART